MPPQKEAPPPQPSAAAWKSAVASATKTVCARYQTLDKETCGEIARDAATKSAGKWRGEHGATFATYVVKAALRDAGKRLDRLRRESLPPKPAKRKSPRNGERRALGAALEEFIQHLVFLHTDAIVSGRVDPEAIRLELRTFLPHVLASHEVPESQRPKLSIPSDFDERLREYTKGIVSLADGEDCAGAWIESKETLRMPLKIAGRRADRYASIPEEVREDMRERHAGLVFDDKREEAAGAVIRYALDLSGLPRTLLNALTSSRRVARKREEDAERARLVQAYRDATKGQL